MIGIWIDKYKNPVLLDEVQFYRLHPMKIDFILKVYSNVENACVALYAVRTHIELI